MRVMVTGSSGFAGRRIALFLAEQDDIQEVLALDKAPAVVFHPKIKAQQIDLTDWRSFASLSVSPPDAIIHTAADQATPYLGHANRSAMKAILDYCQERGVSRFIFFSSLYASLPCNNVYRYAKLDCEMGLRRSGMRYVIFRPESLYAYGEPKLLTLQKAIQKGWVPVVGSGEYLRSPCYLWDLALAIHTILAKDLYPCEAYDVGSPRSLSMNEMISMIAREMGVVRYHRMPLPPRLFKILFSVTQKADADQMNSVSLDRVVCPARFIEALGVTPIDFQEGVRYLVQGDGRWPL